jgi:hypothetical protein
VKYLLVSLCVKTNTFRVPIFPNPFKTRLFIYIKLKFRIKYT